jgi:cbb3-type cytochrome oxidase maturation protein
MDVIYSLIPGMMFFGLAFLAVLIWAVKKGQYEDMEGDGSRILMDDDEDLMEHPGNSKNCPAVTEKNTLGEPSKKPHSKKSPV